MRKFLVCAATAFAAYAFADFDGSYILPRDHDGDSVRPAPVTTASPRSSEQLREGKVKLEFRRAARLPDAVLKALNVPVSSQVLVFSKTSFQAPRISPRMARALYFTRRRLCRLGARRRRTGDRVAWIRARASIFYTMDQEAGPKPRIDRRDECLQCHASGGTLGVPGLVVRSVFVERSGMPLFQAGGFVTDHRSPLSQRWGGWYVTGTHGSQRHMGNVFAEDRDHPDAARPREGRERHRPQGPDRHRQLPGAVTATSWR